MSDDFIDPLAQLVDEPIIEPKRRKKAIVVEDSYPSIINTQEEEEQAFLGVDASPKKGRRKWFRPKCCLITLAILIILITAAFLIVWFAVIPSVATSQMRRVGLKINSISMNHPSIDSVKVSMNLTLTDLEGATSFGSDVQVDSAQLSIQYNGTEVGRVGMPAVAIGKGQSNIDLVYSDIMTVTDQNWFSSNLDDVLAKETFLWNLKAPDGLSMQINGVPIVKQLNLHGIEFNKDVKLKGMQNFTGVRITQLEIPENLNWLPIRKGTVQPGFKYQGLRVQSKIIIPNPSDIVMQLPDTTFSLYYKSPFDNHKDWSPIPLGLITAQDMMLTGGDNEVLFNGALLHWDTLPEELRNGVDHGQYIELLSEFFGRYVHGEECELITKGFSFTDEFPELSDTDRPRLPPMPSAQWLLNPLKRLELKVKHQHDRKSKGHTHVTALDVQKINFKIRHGDQVAFKPVVAGTIKATMAVPYKFDVDVVGVKQELSIYRCFTSCEDRRLVGHLRTQWDDADTEDDLKSPYPKPFAVPGRMFSVLVKMNNSTRGRSDNEHLDVPPEALDNYKMFVRDLMLEESIDVWFQGSVSANIDLGLGLPLYVNQLEIAHQIKLPGIPQLLLGGPQGLKTFQNLAVQDIQRGGVAKFSIAGSYMRRFTNWTVGIEVDGPMYFDLFYTPTRDPTSKHISAEQYKQVQIGKVLVPSLNLGDTGDCRSEVFDPLSNSTWYAPEGTEYCTIIADGNFQPVASDVETEICEDRDTCVSRSFLTSYITNQALHGGTELFDATRITLKATKVQPDLDAAKDILVLPDLEIAGYRTSANTSLAPPFPIVRRIVVQPTGNIISGKISGWLDLYNPLQIPMRYYYMNIDTFVGQTKIGSLQVNFTNYDPFEFKQGYEFTGYNGKRRTDRRNDPYGPHASKWCLRQNDCQVGPIDLAPSGKDGPDCADGYQTQSTITNRTEVGFQLSSPAVYQFWKSLWNKHGSEVNVTVRGQVLLALNMPPYTGPSRLNNTDPPTQQEIDDVISGRMPADKIDPYHFGVRDFKSSPYLVTWNDFGQKDTLMQMRRIIDGENGRPEPLEVPQCESKVQ